ncbi:ferredoxin--NADP reductase [Candidatus Binatia bacterium]|nr:ferredoxin--NADP reductase [Candidatus Binatia bacterium]
MIETRLADRREWAPGLVTLTLATTLGDFEPGQWTNVALDLDGNRVRRAYSLASAPGAPAELFVSRVSGGGLTPKLIELAPGDALLLDPNPLGFFTLKWVPDARELWMLATGTGLAPYVSMLRQGDVFSRFERIVVVHGVREDSQLAYRDEIRARRVEYVPAVSALNGRITALIARGELVIDPRRAHVMLCGNPAMIEEASSMLAERGLRRHRQRKPGHVTVESYW